MTKVRGLIKAFGYVTLGIYLNIIMSCASKPLIVEPELVRYKQRFIQMTKYTEKHFLFYDIKFESLPKNIVGLCSTMVRTIKIDPVYWGTASQKEKDALMFHEMTHCICWERLHDNEKREDGCPVSLMNSSLPGQKCLDIHWDNYMEELIGRCN